MEPHLDLVKASQNNNPDGYSKSRLWRKIGSIPLIVIDKWFREGFNALENSPEARKELRRRLNEHNKFRTVGKAV